jgi:hypothetical protein
VKPKREVVDNTLSSTSPKLRVKVDSSFTYLGDLQFTYLGDLQYDSWIYHVSEHSRKTKAQKIHSFVFVTTKEDKIRKILAISIQKMKGDLHYTSDQLANVKNMLDHGNLRLAGKRFQYYNKVVFPSMAYPVIQYVYDEGYSFPFCTLRVYIVRVQDLGKKLITFNYLEDIFDPDYDCTSVNWKSKAALSDKQRDLLDRVTKNCMAAFEVLE